MRASYCALLSMLCIVQSQRTFLDDNINLFRYFREWGFNLIGRTSSDGGKLLQDAKDQRRLQAVIPLDVPFPCNVTGARSQSPPSSVHKVRPGDIDIVGAMGDSLTAGFGAVASNLLHVVAENRGVSWSGGGQGTWREYLTIPNIIKEFNPKLMGFAHSDSLTTHKESQFNVAEGGAMSSDTPYMADVLVKRIKNDPRVDLKNHWKLISIMIGANDFCSDMCYLSSPWLTVKNHRSDLIQVLRTLRDNLPRTIVSLIYPPNLKALVETTGHSLMCRITTDIECPCFFGLRWRRQRKEFYEIITKWQTLEEDIAVMPEFQKNDFTVLVQPFTSDVVIPKLPSGSTDMSFFSTDCFHLSQKGYAKGANALWNNLLEPIGEKTRSWEDPSGKFLCPTPKRPYIATLGN